MDEGWSSAMSVISSGNNELNCEKASYFQILTNFSERKIISERIMMVYFLGR